MFIALSVFVCAFAERNKRLVRTWMKLLFEEPYPYPSPPSTSQLQRERERVKKKKKRKRKRRKKNSFVGKQRQKEGGGGRSSFFGKPVKAKTGYRHICIYLQAQKPRMERFNKRWVPWVCNKEGLDWQHHTPTCELNKADREKMRSANRLKGQEKKHGQLHTSHFALHLSHGRSHDK